MENHTNSVHSIQCNLQYTVKVFESVLLLASNLCEAVQVHCCPLYELSMVSDNTDTATVLLL